MDAIGKLTLPVNKNLSLQTAVSVLDFNKLKIFIHKVNRLTLQEPKMENIPETENIPKAENIPEAGYIKIKFGSDFDAVSSSFEKSIEDMFRSLNPIFTLCDRAWNPQMDIYETHEEIIIRAEIAGVDKDDIEVEINSKAVRIQGKRTEITRIENATYMLAEIQYGCFERILFLPSPIDPEIVSASYLNGFLQIRLFKMPISDE